MEDIPITGNPFLPEVSRHSIGAMNAICSSCGAFMSIRERKIRRSISNPAFQMCYIEGTAMLAPLEPTPAVITDLLIRNDSIAQELKKILEPITLP